MYHQIKVEDVVDFESALASSSGYGVRKTLSGSVKNGRVWYVVMWTTAKGKEEAYRTRSVSRAVNKYNDLP